MIDPYWNLDRTIHGKTIVSGEKSRKLEDGGWRIEDGG